MDKTAVYEELEKGFVSTFMEELLPGVLHNFANPLNGIMGRSKLLQRRLEEAIKKMEARLPGFAQDFGSEKIMKDVNIISEESDRFFMLFGDLSRKFMSLTRREPEKINLSQLIEAEMRFADFYLDFKHDLQKDIRLDMELPDIIGSTADYSLAITTFLISAKERTKNSLRKEFSITTDHDAEMISVTIKDSGEEVSQACQQLAGAAMKDLDLNLLPQRERLMGGAFFLFKYYGARVEIGYEKGDNKIILYLPILADR